MDHHSVIIVTMPFVLCILFIKFVTETAHGKGHFTEGIENEAKVRQLGPSFQFQPDAAASSERDGT